MFLKADDTLEKVIARNDEQEQKTMLFLVEFGRYLEAAEKGVPVFVCERCLDARLDEERIPGAHCFRVEDEHEWQEFQDKPALEKYIRENIARHYARA